MVISSTCILWVRVTDTFCQPEEFRKSIPVCYFTEQFLELNFVVCQDIQSPLLMEEITRTEKRHYSF